MEITEIALYAQSILWGILKLATIIICSILVYKKKSIPFILMLIATVLSLIFQILNPILLVFLNDSVKDVMLLNITLGTFSLISQIIFITGLGMFAIKFPKNAAT